MSESIAPMIQAVGEKAAELNALLAELPSSVKVEIDVTEHQTMDAAFPIQIVTVNMFKWLGGNRRG